MKSKIAGIVVAVALLSTAAGSLCAQKERLQQQKKAEEGIKVDVVVSAITIAVAVQDKGGKYINDLTAGDFTISENGEKKPITFFKHDFAAPISLTVLLDVSGSMAVQNKLEEIKIGLRTLVTSILDPRDEVSLLIFADGEVEVASRFATDRTEFLDVLNKTEAYGQTALNDAVAVSPQFANRGKNQKRALLLITDGVENDSQVTPDQAVEIARRVDVPIYTIGYKIPLNEQLLKKLKRAQNLTFEGIVGTLDRFSRATGGKAYFVDRPETMFEAIHEIKQEQSHQYLIGYTSNKDEGQAYRRIKVETSNKHYRVRTREGY